MTPQDPLTAPRARLTGKAAVAVAAAIGLAAGAAASGIYAESVTIPRWQSSLAAVTAERDTAASQNATMQELIDKSRRRADSAEQNLKAAEAVAEGREAKAEQRETYAAEREKAVQEREKAVQAREDAVTKTEAAVAAKTITEGTWTVGRDIQPGTYVAKEPVTDTCYWAIYKGGTNGSTIITNGIATGGRPTVTLKAGQDFKSQRCGSWVPA